MLENICQYFPAMIIIGTLLGAVSGWFLKKITTYLNTKDLEEALINKESELVTLRQEVQHLEFEQNRSKKEAIDLMEELDHAKIATMTYQSQIDKHQTGIEEKEQTIMLLNDKIRYYELKWSKAEELSKNNADLTADIDVLNTKIDELKAEILKKDALIVHKSKQLEIEQINQKKIRLESEDVIFEHDALEARVTALSIELEELKKKETAKTNLTLLNKEYLKEIEKLTSEINAMQASNVLLSQENTVVDIGIIMDLRQEITKLTSEINGIQASNVLLSQENTVVDIGIIMDLRQEITKLTSEINAMQASNVLLSQENTVVDISIIMDLRQEITKLTSEINAMQASNVLLNQENTVVDIGKIMDLRQEIAELRIELAQKDALIKVTGTLPAEIRDYRSRILELENNEEKLSKDVSILSSELKEVMTWIKKKKNKIGKNSTANDSKNGVKVEVENVVLAQIKLNAYKIPFHKIGLRLDEKKDDLKKIKSITQSIETRLNAAGINSYVQLVRMQEAEMIIISEVIQIEVNIIISGNWKGEARIILTKIAAKNPKDDLEKIEGIGAKIEELYFNNGIYTFRDLSKIDTPMLQHILKEGGKRFNRHNPETWAKQAELAAAGKWKELKDWQDELDGGRK